MASQADQTVQPERSARKREAIVEAAREDFLDNGYAGTSMDEIAARAGVSKQTIYKNFSDKEHLFTEIITGDIAAADDHNANLFGALADSDDIEQDLRLFARQHVIEVMKPHLVRMRRIVIAEADRFPGLARTWFAQGPARGHQTLADCFAGLAERGLLQVDDPLLAAQHFNWLVLAIPLNEAMFATSDTIDPARLEQYADAAVRVFLAAYGPD